MKIAIIKLGAKGDVVRSLSILVGIKEKYPDSEITWITKKECRDIVNLAPQISKTIILPEEPLGKFDLTINLDIEDEATSLIADMDSEKKLGFYNEGDFVQAYNLGAEYYLNTLFDDETKKSNERTYQEIMFGVAEIPYNKQHNILHLSDKEREYGDDFIMGHNLSNKRLVGIHIGASSRWPSKVWHKENLIDFIKKASKDNYRILLLGGPNEVQDMEDIANKLKIEGINISFNDPHNTDLEFFSLVDSCDSIISGDTFALHVALALNKPSIGLFFCTPPKEIESYNLLTKITSPMLYDFFPEKMDQYSEELTKSISSDQVLKELESLDKITKVVTGIIRDNEKFLLIKRSEGLHKNKWAFPGGIVESSETAEQALRREIKEELGLNIRQIIKKIADYNYPREDDTLTKGESYLIEVDKLDVVPNSEISEARFFSLGEFENLDHI
ncbi:hypothetical protein CMI42_06345, partial [Candidatus Pacearchaeota archaeon]|nr:hypothetical protein [Candidatus Pacearchaeota archaeon]